MRPSSVSHLDTIVALATPPGRSALAVLRLSGPETRGILARLCPALPDPLSPRRATLAAVCDGSGAEIDRGLVTFFPAPASYTGEDVAEISVHGSPVVVERILAAATNARARAARPGEFTERAFLHGKMDLPSAEAVAELVEARTAAAARFSVRRLDGNLSRRFASVREDLLAAAVGLDTSLDFAEDVGAAVPQGVATRLTAAVSELDRLLETYRTGRLLSAGCRVAILGRPNAGKSTLFNALCGSSRAIVTAIPGTTRDALEASVDLAGVPVTVVDTAGLRETADTVERIGVERAREEADRAEFVLYVFDAAEGLSESERASIPSADGTPVLLVANKIDLAPAAFPSDGDVLAVCGLSSGAGAALRDRLSREIASNLDAEGSAEVVSSARQRDLADRARREAASALESLSRGESPEYAASRVHDALDALADLLGETTSEDVLRRIFATFCIGK
jgi:tRNA modification GTPase